MVEKGAANLDELLDDLGCGVFQVLICCMVFAISFPYTWGYVFMTFGLYNPGWKCLDNETTSANTTDTIFSNSSNNPEYFTDSCAGFDTCKHVVFNPEASSIATEFGLVCGRSWIASMMISLYMIGNASAYVFVGMAGDKFGRKVVIQVSLLMLVILDIVSVFSTSWQMFIAVDVLLGVWVAFGSIYSVITNEFVPQVWRIRAGSLPMWTVGLIVFSLLAMVTEDWRTLRIVSCVVSGVCFAALFWLPKTPRFLSAKGKRKQFDKLIQKIVKYNNTEMPPESSLDLIMKASSGKVNRKSPPSYLSLFRKGYRVRTLVIGAAFLFNDLTYFAMTFGISTLPGNIYENMLIISFAELPANLFAAYTGNVAGRRISLLVFEILCSLCLFGVAAFDLLTSGGVRTLSTLASLIVAKVFLNSGWYVLATACLEMYPTLVRGTVNSYARMMSTVGGVLAPFLIPADPDTFHVCYMVMGGLVFAVGLMVLLLPETRGMPLPNYWEDSDGASVVKRARVKEGRSTVV